jgi:ethanolamine utilization protein EutM
MPALGLIETKGLVGAIEAADAALKAANAVLTQIEFSDPAAAVVKIQGEVADVTSAVEAGAASARRVGELVAAHVIPNPSPELDILIHSKPQMTTSGMDVMGSSVDDDKSKGKKKAPAPAPAS